jgi:K+-transporting ATPase ATPase C chain
MKTLLASLKMFAWLTVLTGLVYPLLVTGITQWIFPKQASGSLVYWGDKIIGSELIAQKLTHDKFFWPRPSATDYRTLPAGGSNLAPTSYALQQIVNARRKHITETRGLKDNVIIPEELLFASGSGLDPHISISAAQFQIPRIIKARKWEPTSATLILTQLIQQISEKRQLGILGKPRVNVLKLNLALEAMRHTSSEIPLKQ